MKDINKFESSHPHPAKVCFAPGTLSTGGIGRNTLNLTKILIEQGHIVDLVLIGKEKGERLKEVPQQVNIVQVASRSRYALPGAIRYLKNKKPDLVISAHNHVNTVMTLAKRLSGVGEKCKLVCTFQTQRTIQMQHSSIQGRLYDWLAFRFYGWADHLVAVSQGVADDIEQTAGLTKGTIKVIYNPAWSDASLALSQMPCDHPWLKDKKVPVVISVGRLTRQKEFSTLIKAFSRARSKKEMRLLILGEGEDRAMLQEMIQEHGLADNVDLPGHVSNPLCYMAASDLFVLSSAWEGFGNVIVEALGCGLPVVSTDCPSGPAEILDYGKYGTLVQVGDVEAMAKSMLEALAIPNSPGIQKKRAREFSADVAAQRYLELMKSEK